MTISPYIPSAAIVAPSAPAARSPLEQSGATSPKDAKLMDSCRQFEGQFFDMMLQEMRKTVPDNPIMGDDSHEQQIFQGMMDDDIAQQMAKHAGSNDLAAQLYRQLASKSSVPAAGEPRPTSMLGSPAQLNASSIKTILKKSTITPENREENDCNTAE